MPDVRRIFPVAPEETSDPLINPTNGSYVVSNNNRWSRAVLEFKDLTGDAWCELNFQITWHPEENHRTAHDFAVIGVNFLTEDGSSIEFAYVPGLTRTQIDPHSSYIAGPDYHGPSSDLTHSSKIQCAFLAPAPARHLSIVLRSWRNSHPFTINNPHLVQAHQRLSDEDLPRSNTKASNLGTATPRRTWLPLSNSPTWLSYATVPGHPLVVRGQLIKENSDSDGALVRVIYRDAKGNPLPPPYDEIPVSPDIGPFIGIPVHRQARRFTLDLSPPPQAVTVDLGFQAKQDEARISLAAPLEVSVGSDLLLENVFGEESHDALRFLDEVRGRLEWLARSETLRGREVPVDQLIDRKALASLSTFHDKLRAVQHGDATAVADGQLTLCGQETWRLPEALEWDEDPFQSLAWRLEFQSLSWLLDLARTPELGGLPRAIEFAAAWSQGNPWGQPKDPLSSYPLSMAVRAEVFLHLLAMGAAAKNGNLSKSQKVIFAELLRHGFALYEIVSQNVFSHSVLQLRTACALLAVSQAIPHFPVSAHWASVALAQLRSGFDQLIASDGSTIEQSQHYRLEIISLGLILAHSLDKADALGFREHLLSRIQKCLRMIVAMTDPAGMLPPFGDVLQGHHHASWLRRLISGYGRSLLSDQKLAEELSYPTGSRAFASTSGGVVALRHYQHKPNWSYLCATLGEQRHENGHFDCASFIYTAAGINWITDPGGSSLQDSGSARQYLLSSRAHNIAIPDGREQSAGCGWIEANSPLKDGRIIRIGTNVYGPNYQHARTLICLDDLSAVAVLDDFHASQSRVSFKGLLHFHENIAVALANANLAIGLRNKSRLRIVPHVIAGRYNGMEIQNGRNDRLGSLQGFLSHRASGLQPANVLSYELSSPNRVCGGVILAITEQGLKKIQSLLSAEEVRQVLG